MMMPAAADSIIQTANKPQITTLQADFSHFPGVTLNVSMKSLQAPNEQ